MIPDRAVVDEPAPDAEHQPMVAAVAATAGTNVLLAVVGGGGGIVLARWLGPAARGDLVVIVQWPAILGALASIGITHATTYRVSRDRADAPDIIATASVGALVSGVVLAVVGFLLAPLIGRTPEVVTCLRLLFALSPLYLIGGMWVSALQAVSFRRWNIARSLQPLAYFGVIVVLALAHHLTTRTAVGALVVAFGTNLLLLRFFSGVGITLRGRPRARLFRRLYSYGCRVFLSNVPQTINISLDQLVLSVVRSVSSSQLASYAVAVSLASMALPLSVAFGSVAFPRVAATDDEGDRRKVESFSLIGATASAVAVMGALAAVAGWAVPRVFGSGFKPAVVALWLLSPGTVFLALNRVLDDILRGRGRPTAVMVAEGIGAGLTIGLLLIFVPRYGINGAAAVSSSTYALVFAILRWNLRLARRRELSELSWTR